MTARTSLRITFAASAILILGVAAAFWPRTAVAPAAGAPSPGPVSLAGTLLCLPHSNVAGPQTADCAYGLKDSENRYYGLVDSDASYANLTKYPLNYFVRVDGTFTPGTDRIHPTVGTILISAVSLAD